MGGFGEITPGLKRPVNRKNDEVASHEETLRLERLQRTEARKKALASLQFAIDEIGMSAEQIDALRESLERRNGREITH